MKQIIIDVREPFEFESGHVEGAINIPPAELMSGASKLEDTDKNTPITVYCVSGARSNSAIQILKGMGFTNLSNGINRQQVESKLL